MVGEEGLEPSLPCENQILSLARLPIPPLAHVLIVTRIASTNNRTRSLAQITLSVADYECIVQ